MTYNSSNCYTTSFQLGSNQNVMGRTSLASFLIIFLMATYCTPIIEVNAREISDEVATPSVTDSFVSNPNGIYCRSNQDCYYQCRPRCQNYDCMGGRCFCNGC
ncbi:hypothetical protein Tsubulata_042258 [Turnera subulata]|uniref:Uncharacterized protein n=1 Tax=Turnera subulata TaxID=218843 RepID=A0A9Q0FEF3_9ROSI|nr:hypothetical protein Tsubulata_042258 [Turnera subulata]